MSSSKKCLICNCEKTMPLNEKKLADVTDKINISLCRAQISTFETALGQDEEIIVACTQEAPLFQEVAEEHGKQHLVSFVNVRENAGWSKDADKATPKILALLEDAQFASQPARLKSIASDGMCLVYGAGQSAMEAAKLLSEKLSVTLLLSEAEEFLLPPIADVPIYRGDITQAGGSFGNFALNVDNYAPLRPASREELQFSVARNGATTQCSLILDLSGESPLFSGHQHRDGYMRVDPGDPAAVLKAVIKLSDMVGEFEKPIYVDYNAEICAHSRSQKTGCNKCLDVCPAGAIIDAGDIVEFDSGICGGCGSCHSVCPTGAVSYQFPSRNDIIERAQKLISCYTEAGGKNPVILLHDEVFGFEMISALARFGDGLPANVIPMASHASTVFGHVEMCSLIAAGASQVIILGNPEYADELAALENELAISNEILEGLEIGEGGMVSLLCERDPDIVGSRLWDLPSVSPLVTTDFNPIGQKREIARIAFSKLHNASPNKPDVIVLPEGAPYGRVEIDTEACTLCMACTSACPANAITDTPGEPRLRFTQSACVQCGLCVNTCPEQALTLVPQLDFTPSAQQPETLYEEEPFNCISCGTPFATRSTIERITSQLAGKHSMFADSQSADLIKMCDNCRIQTQANSTNDPFKVGDRPKPRTTEDYIAAERGELTVDDFLIDED